MSYARRFEADIRRAARAEGIALTPAGQALFARDAVRLAELRAADQRTPAEIAEDAAARIASAYEAHLAEQAAQADGPTPLDPGSPEEAAYARGRDDERRRATHHAHALAARAFSAPVAYPAVLDMANAISGGKAAP